MTPKRDVCSIIFISANNLKLTMKESELKPDTQKQTLTEKIDRQHLLSKLRADNLIIALNMICLIGLPIVIIFNIVEFVLSQGAAIDVVLIILDALLLPLNCLILHDYLKMLRYFNVGKMPNLFKIEYLLLLKKVQVVNEKQLSLPTIKLLLLRFPYSFRVTHYELKNRQKGTNISLFI